MLLFLCFSVITFNLYIYNASVNFQTSTFFLYIKSFSALNCCHRTTGNGNCLFNACSLAIAGDESLSSCLRCLTSIELYLHSEFYAMHPTIQYCHKNGACVHESSAFVLSLSFHAADSVAKSDRTPAVQAEAKIIAKNFSFASFLCMLGLATVIDRTIESYFPIKEEANLSSYETMFNSTILPRNPKYSGAEKVHIFRCAIAPIDFLFNNKIPELKNHYVPLVPIECLQLGASISSKIANKSNGPAQGRACTTITVPVSVPGNLPLKMNKRKQRQAKINFPSKIIKTDSAIENSDNTSCAIVNPPQLNYPPNEVPTFTLSIPEDAALAHTDIGSFYLQAKNFPDNVKYQLLCNIGKPDSTFTFHVNSSGRRFQLKCL